MRRSGQQMDPVSPRVADHRRLQFLDGRCGKVCAPVLHALRSELRQQQARPHAELEHPLRPQREDPVHGGRTPLLHLLERDRIVGVAAVPSPEIVAELDRVEIGVIELVVDALPLVDNVGVVVGAAGLLEGDVADQVIDTGAAPMHGRGRACDLRAGKQGVLDLAQFQSLPSQLDLGIGAPQVFQATRSGPAHEVAGAIQPRPRCAKGVGHEPIRRQVGPADVAPGHRWAGQVQLTHDSDRSGIQPRIEYERVGPRNR
ncbi:hypothetical protein MBOE_04100 [Mycolicibacterium boenickei]|uniref:Uncharacterized protein n=1 Tax=Mycolicibacterium boenickei TaxID=146017 RepID=A0ABM7IPQ8_9MYCO|nr:hypothetical protein MBOE_04100 [Mycolicibacterium boenickei]